MSNYLNLSFYKFVELNDLPQLRATLKEKSRSEGLKGTLILSGEGINGFLAGPESIVRPFMAYLRTIPEFSDLTFKESWSEFIPFRKMMVKLKKELIPMGLPYIKPKEKTGARIYPKELKAWLDQGKEVVLLDTRNDYELADGTFEGAVDMHLKFFRDFPQKLSELKSNLEGKPVVMFCTGGIRCEKATAYALSIGMENVYQLEGGIIKYFEEVGGAHYKGNCFVFDDRAALDAELHTDKKPRY